MVSDEDPKPLNLRKLHWACLFALLSVAEFIVGVPFILLGWAGSWAFGWMKVGHRVHQQNIDRELEIIKWLRE